MSTIRIPIPSDLLEPNNDDLEETDLREYFGDMVRPDQGEFHGDFMQALDTFHGDYRAVLDDVWIEGVQVEGDVVHVNFVTSHSAYYGCEDANWAEDDHRSVTGKRVVDEWVFDVFVAPERTPPDLEGPDD
ncbi:MAG: hypothetical protein Q7V16_00355 [Hydrogenophaga sp.]|nr:hypothetical protein [Hydrogenophaga sp.]